MAGLMCLLELTKKGNIAELENVKGLFILHQLPELVVNSANRFIDDRQIQDVSHLVLRAIDIDTKDAWLESVVDKGQREKQDWWKRRYTPVDTLTPKQIRELRKSYYKEPKH